MIVTRWGVHWAQGGISFLHQKDNATAALPVALPSPFVAACEQSCPHAIR